MAPLSLDDLTACGLDELTAIALLPQINHWLASLPAIACWQQLTQHLLTPDHPFALHECLYQTVFADWEPNQGPPPAWIPSDTQIQSTHLADLMQELQIDAYADLHAWSVQHRGEFWERMIQRLGIRLRQPYTQILDLAQGAEYPKWLVGARMNCVESCFQAPDSAPAVVFQKPGGAIATWSYAHLQARTNRVANGLVELGFQVGDAIAISMPMTAESVAIYLGIITVGCVAVSIADSFAASEIATRLQIAHAKAIFTQDVIRRIGKQLPLYEKVVAAEAPRAIVLAEGDRLAIDLRPGDLTWETFLSCSDRTAAVSLPPSAHTNILFSSGTTGTPKAIPWTHATPIKCAADGHLHQDIHPGDVVAWPTNLGWMMGPWLIYASLINQATIALYYDAPTQRSFGQFVQDAHVTMLGVVPSLVSHWKTTDCMRGLDWRTIKAFSSTGECSNPQDMLFLMSLAGYRPIIEYCGGTEIGGSYITGTLVQPAIPATFTTPALGLDLVLLDDTEQLAGKGEVFIIPPSIGLSTELLNADHHQTYFANTPALISPSPRGVPSSEFRVPSLSPSPDLPIPPFPHPSLRRHGDQLECLPNGYYRAQGRVDDTMNLGGIKVSSAEIEQVLNQVVGIQETAAIAISPTNSGPTQLVIYAVVASDQPMQPEAMKRCLQAAIVQHLNPLFKIHDLVIVPQLPRTASNKVMRRVLRDQYKKHWAI